VRDLERDARLDFFACKGSDRAGSDLDLLAVSDDLGYADVYTVLQSAEIVPRPASAAGIPTRRNRVMGYSVRTYGGRSNVGRP
jgi:hypothetical protein